MGRVYFFRETGRKYVKIGMTRSDSVGKRFKTFKMYAACGAYVVGSIKTKTPKKLESEIHKIFAYARKQGEFFELNDHQVKNIIRSYENGKVNASRQDLVKQKVSNELMALEGQVLTNNDILERIKKTGIALNHTSLGIILKDLGYEKKSMKRNKKVRQYYML